MPVEHAPSSGHARRIVTEFLLIVAGVLTALAVNATWQGHVDRVREEAYLTQLQLDVLDNEHRLEEALRLMELARPPGADSDEDHAARALVALQENREAAAVFRLFRFNIESRIWYLTQMLSATREFAAVLRAEKAFEAAEGRETEPANPADMSR